MDLTFFSNILKSNLNLLLKITSIGLLAAGSQGLIAKSAFAGTALTTKETFSGKVNYTVTGGTLRSASNSRNACSLTSSSTAQLSGIPSNATVKKAYLYWGGSGSTVDSQITLDGTTLTADKTYRESFVGRYNFFQGVKDVTNIVTNKGNGNYQFKDLSVDSSRIYCDAQAVLSAWSLVVIYDDPSIDKRKLNTIELYEGFKASRNQRVNYTLDGIKVARNPVAKFSMLIWEGDESLGGSNEFFSFNQNTLTDSYNPANNQFNSSINTLNTKETYGIDLDTFDVSSYVSAGDTSITGTISTNNDLVFQGAALVMVTDELANAAPSAQPDIITTDEDTEGTYNLISGDRNNNYAGQDADPEGDTLYITKINVGDTEYAFDGQSSLQVTMPSGAILTVESDGDVTYDPNGKFESLQPGQTGENPDKFTYTVSDSEGSTSSATVTVNINGVADDPVAVDDTKQTDENTIESIFVLENDSDPNIGRENLTITKINDTSVNVGDIFTLDSGATLKLREVESANRNAKGKHKLIYNPTGSPSLNFLNEGQSHEETFTYTVSDPEGNTDTGNVTITVDGITDTYSD